MNLNVNTEYCINLHWSGAGVRGACIWSSHHLFSHVKKMFSRWLNFNNVIASRVDRWMQIVWSEGWRASEILIHSDGALCAESLPKMSNKLIQKITGRKTLAFQILKEIHLQALIWSYSYTSKTLSHIVPVWGENIPERPRIAWIQRNLVRWIDDLQNFKSQIRILPTFVGKVDRNVMQNSQSANYPCSHNCGSGKLPEFKGNQS